MNKSWKNELKNSFLFNFGHLNKKLVRAGMIDINRLKKMPRDCEEILGKVYDRALKKYISSRKKCGYFYVSIEMLSKAK